MRDIIEQGLAKTFPGLAEGLHLDRYGRIKAIADQPDQGAACERFRPRYAVDVQILTPELEPDPAFPLFTAVPLPVPCGAGQESGSLAFPEPGALVIVGFAYGRQDHPVIRQIYPLGVSLPSVAPGEIVQQKSPAVFQKADAAGNWTRQTDASITDQSITRRVKAVDSEQELSRETKTVSATYDLDVGSAASIAAGVLLSLLSGQRADLGALGDINLTAGGNASQTTAGNVTETVGKDKSSAIKGSRSANVTGSEAVAIGQGRTENIGADQQKTVGGQDEETIAGAKTINAASILLNSGSTITVKGKGGMSLFQELLGAIAEIKAALDVLASHDHPDAGTINQGAAVAGHSNAAGGHRANMAGITG